MIASQADTAYVAEAFELAAQQLPSATASACCARSAIPASPGPSAKCSGVMRCSFWSVGRGPRGTAATLDPAADHVLA